MASTSRLPAARSRPAAGASRSRPISMIEGPMLNLDLPKENDATSKQAKRRSLLPTFSRKASNEEKAEIKEEAEDGDDGGHADSVAGSTDVKSRNAVEEADRRAMPPPSKLSRPTSLYGAGGLSRAPSVRSHAREAPRAKDSRADALAALEGTASTAPTAKTGTAESGLKRTSSTRLPQGPAPRGLARTASVRTKEAPGHGRTGSTNTTTSATSEKRRSAVQTRPLSIGEPPSPSKTVSAATQASPVAASKPRNRESRQMPPPPRPTFNTYQQHYSPVKSALPKPPIPSVRAAKSSVSAEEETPVSFDVAKQQIELLQLSILHQASQKALRGYDASAQRKLSRKHAKLRKEYDTIRAAEAEQRRISNISALDTWCPDAALLAEALQVLGKVYAEVTGLVDAGGRYAQLVGGFEDWVESAEPSAPSAFVEALPDDWRKAHTSLALGLRALQRDLGMLPPPPRSEAKPSSLEVLYACCSSLVDGALRELEIMHKLEREILAREKARVEEEVKAFTEDASLTTGLTKPWIPAWRSVA